MSKFIDEQGINYPIVMGNAEVAEAFGGVEAIPTTFLVDREGQLVDRKVGYKPAAYYEALLDGLAVSRCSGLDGRLIGGLGDDGRCFDHSRFGHCRACEDIGLEAETAGQVDQDRRKNQGDKAFAQSHGTF